MRSNNHVADTKTLRNNNMMVATSSSSAGVLGLMSKTTQTQPQQPLKCPRCGSLNTKFCYYNNYSFSQPRHFCKACKRYWTRGGTLRNVPTGGTCRKNKRIKRSATASYDVVSSSSSSIDGSSNSTTSLSTSIPYLHINHFSPNGYVNPFVYGLSDVSSGDTLPLISSRFRNSKGFESGFEFNGFSDFGLGFPHIGENMGNSMAAMKKPLFPVGLFGEVSSPSTPSMAALLASSSFHPQKLIINGGDHIPRDTDSEILRENSLQTLKFLQDLHVGSSNNQDAILMDKEGKLDYEISGYIGFSSDPSNYNTNVIGAWRDPTTNVASSLTPLI